VLSAEGIAVSLLLEQVAPPSGVVRHECLIPRLALIAPAFEPCKPAPSDIPILPRAP
jgi:hypothetical protein